MAGRKTSIAVHITGDVKDFKRAMGEAESSAQKMSRRLDSIGNKLTLGVTVPMAAMGAVAVSAASDLEEALDKTDAIFGKSAEEVKAWSKTSAEAMGLASAEALDAAGNLGNMMQSAGVASGDAADLSMTLVQLAADMGSLNNVDPSEMLVKLMAGMAGEAEPLRRFGVDINAAAVSAKALELGLVGVGEELSQQDKLMARYAIIMEQTTTAQGNFADTADGAANQTRILKASVTDLAAQLGTNLLPMAKTVLTSLNNLVSAFAGLDEGTQKAIINIGLLAAAAGPLAKLTSWAIKGGIAVKGLWTALAAYSAGGGLVVGAINGIAAAAAAAAAAFTAAAAAAVSVPFFWLTQESKTAEEQMIKNATAANLAGDSMGALGAGAQGFVSAQLDAAKATEKNTWATEESAKAMDEWRTAAQQGRSTAISFHDPIMHLAAAYEQTKLEASKATVAIGTTGQAMLDALNPVAQLRNANDRYSTALAAVQELEAEGKKGTKEYEDAMWELLEATGNVQAAHDKFSLTGVSDDFRNLAARIGLTSAELEAMIALFAGLDGASVTTTKTTGGISVDSSGWNLTRFHDGGVIPGVPGTEVPILAMAGETVLPTHKTGYQSGGTEVIQVVLDGAVVAEAVRRHNTVAARRGAF